MAGYLDSHRVRPQLVLCSSARRARETLEVVRTALGASADVEFDAELYGADSDLLLGRLQAVRNEVESVMLVGHNPGLQDLALMLAGDGEPRAMDLLRAKFPTGALAILEVGAPTWAELGLGGATLTRLVLPAELADQAGV
jgi:phosphohistidine phosphatase